MSHLGYGRNEYGTRISLHKCDTCGVEFSVVPAVFPETSGWDSCLAPQCASYDRARDLEPGLEDGSVEVRPALPKGRA